MNKEKIEDYEERLRIGKILIDKLEENEEREAIIDGAYKAQIKIENILRKLKANK